MFMHRALLSILIFSLLFITGCSSLPGRKETRILDTKNKAAEYLKDGIVQFNSGRYSRALELFDLAYQLNASVDHEEGIVATYNSMGRTMLMEGNLDKALEVIEDALEISERLGNTDLVMSTTGNLANYYVKVDEFDKASSLIKGQLAGPDAVNSEESAILAHNLSLVLRKQKNYDEALAYLNSSLKYNQKNDLFKSMAADYYMLASVYSLKSEYATALQFAKQALIYDKMIEYPQGIAADLDALAIISDKMGLSAESEIYRERHENVLKALKNINKIEDEQTESQE